MIQCMNVHKKYMSKTALKNINLKMESGKIYGLLGPNGSGKTTLMKILANLHRQSSGEVMIGNADPSFLTKKIVAFMPTDDFIYGWMRIKDSVNFFREMYADFDLEKVEKLINFMELDRSQKVSSLSTGQYARLKIILTLSRNSRIYLLDEPLNGLDPISREKIKETIVKQHNSERIFVIATHLVSEVEGLLDEVVFLNGGETVLAGDTECLRQQYGKNIEGIYKEVFARAEAH